jgi:hypothetical protein
LFDPVGPQFCFAYFRGEREKKTKRKRKKQEREKNEKEAPSQTRHIKMKKCGLFV